MRQVALLRGVNVGGRKLIMSELRALVESAGFTKVSTLLASGNLVLNAKVSGRKLEEKLEALILDEFNLKTDVFVRARAELDALIAANPFRAFTQKHPAFMVVNFMRAPVTDRELAAMQTTALREEWRQGEGGLYIKFPDGQGPSKLTLPKLGTARNWNTVLKLAAAVREE